MARARVPTRSATPAWRRRRVVVPALAVVLVGCALGGWFLMRHRTAPSPPPAPAVVESVTPAPRPTTVVQFSDGCMTARCHVDLAGLAVRHAPIAAGTCDTCHDPDTGGHVYPVSRDAASTCLACHSTDAHAVFPHGAEGFGACLTCHAPHGSNTVGMLAASSTTELCRQCHPTSKGHVAHDLYAQGQCSACHDAHGSTNARLLAGGDGPDHCRMCHEPEAHASATLAHSHRDIEGSCLGCHEPHASDHAGMLATSPRQLCVSCHADVGAAVASGVVSHDPVFTGEQCVTCHDPHASSHPAMLRNTQHEVCLSCHSAEVKASDGRVIREIATSVRESPVVHGAIGAGECSACHAVHGGTIEHMLTALNPRLVIGAYDVQHYGLCFSCHDKSIADAKGSTGFRDGEVNLHALHLHSEDRAQSCGACHAVHAGDLPSLVARTVRFQGSDWDMPIGFVPTPTGGSCASGCHEVLAYDRRPGGARAPANRGDR